MNQCIECSEDEKLCKKCNDGYFPDKNGGCSYTDNCEISYRGECIKCKDDYILIGEENYNGEIEIKICKSLISGDLKNCEIINNKKGFCEKCKEGFYLNEGDKKCIKTENCYESIFEICNKCNYGYYLDKKELKCKNQTDIFEHCKESLDGKKCDVCDDNYYFDEQGKCIVFNYCLKLKNMFKCDKCEKNYYLTKTENSCVSTENFYKGDKDIGICSTCNDGYYLDFKDSKCKKNQEDNEFKYCRIAVNGKCIQCLLGYYLGEDNKCSNTNNCAESDNGTCLTCSDKYYLGLDNKCSDVKYCIYSNYYSCLECEDNYYYDKKAKKCIKAKDIFENCKTGYSSFFCETCKNDFYHNHTDYQCYSNKEKGPFYKCSKTDFEEEYCTECIDGYYLGIKDNKCTLIDGCAFSENENKCIECDTDYCLDKKNGKCFMNDEIISEEKKFYYRCNETNKEGNKCEICDRGFILNKKGLCVDNIHCVEEDEDKTCNKCQDNDEEHFCLNKDFGCVDIYYSGQNCLECNDNMDFFNSSKCFDGYSLNENGNCIKN